MDPVRTTIMANRFHAIVEEASTTLFRTAHTTFVKLVQDYQCAIATKNGDIFAYPLQNGVVGIIGVPLQACLAQFDINEFKPGDCIVTNDPFSTDGMLTHLMDITLVRPIFVGDRLVGFGWAFVHATDIGGAVPGSISPGFTEVFQEGLRVRPMKLYNAGVLDENILNIYLDNSRIPDEMWGDFKAMLASVVGMERRINQLAERYGVDAVCEDMEAVLELADQTARKVIKTIPDGTYNFSDYLEGVVDGELSLFNLSMTVQDDEIYVDFSGTDPQIPAAYNMTTGARTHSLLVQAIVSFVLTLNPLTPRNVGMLRPIKTNAPPGCILNAVFPAAGGSRVASSARLFDSLIGCLNQAVEGGLSAAGAGMLGVIVVGAPDRRTHKNRVNIVNPICGGGGGRNGSDGVDGTDVRYGTLMSIPVEVVEAETFLLIRSYKMLPDSQGAGKWRSGAAVRIEFENTGMPATITVRGLNRFLFRPWGTRGGETGRLTTVVADPGTSKERQLGKITIHKMERGDVLQITSSAGGGFGDPLERDVATVATDVSVGMVSRERAASSYGVVFDDAGRLDAAGTESIRAAKRLERDGVPLFSWGKEREAQDILWPPALRAELAREAFLEPQDLRHPLISLVCRRVRDGGTPVTAEALREHLKFGRSYLYGEQAA